MEIEKTVSRARSRSKKKRQAIIGMVKAVVIILLVVLFIWSLFSMIIESNMLKDRRNTGAKTSKVIYLKSEAEPA